MNNPLDVFADRLIQLQQEIAQSPSPPLLGSDLMLRLQAVVAEMKTTAQKSLEDLKAQSEAKAAEIREKAEALKRKQEAAEAAERGEEPATPAPQPWEDHQGLDDDAMQELVNRVKELATAPPPEKRTAP